MIQALIPVIAGIIGKLVDRAVPDKDQAEQLKAQLQSQLLAMRHQEFRAAADIIIAEATGESWLQRSWRPIVMLTFCGLIVARWLGFTAPNLTEPEYLALWDIVKIGLGGYVVGRSAEKVTKAWTQQK